MRRLAAGTLAALGLLGLVVGAVRTEPPIRRSLRSLVLFWSANETTRLLNSSPFIHDRELGIALLRADSAWPLSWDATLTLPDDTPTHLQHPRLARAAYVLAPRRVLLKLGDCAPGRFKLDPIVPRP